MIYPENITVGSMEAIWITMVIIRVSITLVMSTGSGVLHRCTATVNPVFVKDVTLVTQ